MRSLLRSPGVFLAFLACVPLASCQFIDKVQEDKRTEYLKSRTLPDLEIPPDLVAESAGEPLAIPGEETLGVEVPGVETPGEETPVEEALGEEAPVEGAPVEETPVEEVPGAETLVEKAPGAEAPGAELSEAPGEEPETEAGVEPEAEPGEESVAEPAREPERQLAEEQEAPEQAERQAAGEDSPAAGVDEAAPRATEPAEAEPQSLAVAKARQRTIPSPPLAAPAPQSKREDAPLLTEQLVAVRGDWQQVWSLLQKFWNSKGLPLDLEDDTLGVMETAWTVPYLQQEMTVRNRFKLFLEPGPEDGILHVVLSSEKEVYLEQEEGLDGDWLLQDPDLLLEKKYASELQGFLGRHL